MKFLMVLVLFVLVFLGCSPNWYIYPKYQSSALSEKVLGVLPITENVKISYQGSVENEFGEGDADSLILEHVNEYICEYISKHSKFGSVLCGNLKNQTKYVRKALSFEKDEEEYSVPSNVTEFQKGIPDVVLAISDLTIVSVTTVNMVYFVPVGYTRSLNIELKFVYWDQKNNEPIAIGEASDSEGGGLAIQIDDWNNILDIIAEEILLDGEYSNNQ